MRTVHAGSSLFAAVLRTLIAALHRDRKKWRQKLERGRLAARAFGARPGMEGALMLSVDRASKNADQKLTKPCLNMPKTD
jgi:hypothetical protein